MSCEQLHAPPAPFRLVLPGAAELIGFDLAALGQPALAPLAPLFRIVDVVTKAVDVLRAIPDTLSMPPNPTAIVQRLPALLQAASELVPLVPQVSVPLTAATMLDAAIEELRRTRGRIEALEAQARRIERARDRALAIDDLRLAESAGCAERDLRKVVEAALAPLEALRGLLGVLGLLLGLAGGPPLPPWRLGDAADRAALVRDILAIERSLVAVREGLPLP
jgi:hypothetical protein